MEKYPEYDPNTLVLNKILIGDEASGAINSAAEQAAIAIRLLIDSNGLRVYFGFDGKKLRDGVVTAIQDAIGHRIYSQTDISTGA
jgi:hypothetical protein